MKKILLATSALISAAGMVAVAHAEAPKVTLGGYIDFQGAYTDQDTQYRPSNSTFSRDTKFANDTQVDVKVAGKSDNGLGYGAVIKLEADVSRADDNRGFNADRTYIFLDSGIGRLELGSNVSPAESMRIDASTFARATGGIDGDAYHYANFGNISNISRIPAGAAFANPGHIVSPDLPTSHAYGAEQDATKVTYYTPRIIGFQVGGSFTPDTGNAGSAAGFTTEHNPFDAQNVFDVGVNYKGQYRKIGFAASATGEFGEAEKTAVVAQRLRDLDAYAFGANATFLGFTVGGSYGDWGKSLQPRAAGTANIDDAEFWDAGIGYEYGPFGISVTYLDSTYRNSDFNNLSVGADYKLAPGLVPYVEVNFFDADPVVAGGGTITTNNSKNNGTAVLVGTQLTF